MEKASFSLYKLAILVALLACVNGQTFGEKPKGGIRMSQKTKMVIEELVIKKPERIELVQLQPEIMKSSQQVLQCVGAGSYCNTVFGPSCCSSPLACLPGGLVGGVCVA